MSRTWLAVIMDADSETDSARDETFRLLFDAIPLPAWIVDAETLRFREVKAAAVAAYGYAREEFLALLMAPVWQSRRAGSPLAPRLVSLRKGGEAPGMARGLILVVDDDEAVLELIGDTLQDAGYEVVTACDGAALHVAHERQPNVILLDLVMPVMDGVEVSRRLRADPATAQIPIIAMSSAPQLLTALPVNDRLAKPFGLDQLCAMVAYWIRAPASRRIHWRDAAERSYAFDRTARRVVASCIHGRDRKWWVMIRNPTATYGPFTTCDQARTEAEKYLLA